jgi:hypothetical protein
MAKRVSFLTVLTLLWGIFTLSFAQIPIHGPLSGTMEGNDYLVVGEIWVERGDSLFIGPRTTFLFDGYFCFEIKGIIRAEGTEEDSILFTPNLGTVNWQGFYFNHSRSDTSILRYCLIEGGNSNGIKCYSSHLIVDHCTVRRNSSGGVSWGGGIFIGGSCNPLIMNSLITENKGVLGGGITLPGQSRATIRNCIITRNQASCEGAGINLEGHGSYALIDHCLIAYNAIVGTQYGAGGGIRLCSNAQATILNCTVVYNHANPRTGGGINATFPAHIANSIIANNTGGGLVTVDHSTTRVEYGCFYHNEGNDFILYGQDSLGILSMVNSNGDSCDIYHNIIMNPLFVNLQNHDYHLQANSPCIDAGDPRTPFDPDSTIADIGAYYFDQGRFASLNTNFSHPEQFGLLMNYPNPFNTSTQISYSLANTSQVELTISNILGQHVATLFNGIQSVGMHSIIWNPSDLASGIYFARLQSGEQIKTIRIVMMK